MYITHLIVLFALSTQPITDLKPSKPNQSLTITKEDKKEPTMLPAIFKDSDGSYHMINEFEEEVETCAFLKKDDATFAGCEVSPLKTLDDVTNFWFSYYLYRHILGEAK